MDERARMMEPSVSPKDVDRYLAVVIRELEGLPSLAETWPAPGESTDEVDSYNSWWESVAGARMNRLESAHRAGLMSPAQESRYARAKKLFEARMPLLERYGLDKPTVPLGG